MTQIRGPRVHLRPLTAEDTDLVLRWRSDPAIARHLFSERPPTREEHERFLENLRKSDDRFEFAIVLNENDVAVGTIGLSGIDKDHGQGEYGILIGDESVRGLGIAREASELLLGHAFRTLGLQRVILNVFQENEAALGLYRRLGFQIEADSAGVQVKNGVPRPVMRMVIEHRVEL